MGTGYIDSASVTEIVSTYMFEKPDEVFAWNWETAQEVTCALITSNCLRLAPSLTPEGAPSGPYGETLKTLSGIVNIADIDPAIRQKATEKTKRWASRNYRKVRTNYEELKADQKYFTRWLEGDIINTWPEFSRRLGGLFDYKFVPQIASIIDTSEVDIKEIWHLSRDLNTVENYAKHQPDKDGFKLLRDAYMISVLLRGRYHEYVAVGSRLKIMHHPVRNSVLLNLQGRPKTKFPVNVAQYLSNMG